MNTRWGLLGLLALSGCIGASRGNWYPLYEGRRPASAVSRVSGYVRFVDGRDLAEHGRSFEVLPGCHVVGTPEKWGESSLDEAHVATTGVVLFALPMQAGHQYAIDVRSEGIGGPVRTLHIEARETDPGGEIVRTFSPVKNQAEIDGCLAG